MALFWWGNGLKGLGGMALPLIACWRLKKKSSSNPRQTSPAQKLSLSPYFFNLWLNLSAVVQTKPREMFLQMTKASPVNVSMSFRERDRVSSSRYLHWMAQYSFSLVSAIRSIPSSGPGRLRRERIWEGTSFRSQTFFSLVA